MKIKVNTSNIISDFDEGYIIYIPSTTESFYIEKDIYQFFNSAINEFVSISDLLPEGYNEEEFESFINELLGLGIIIKEKNV
ncbi:hypothetical protein C1N66_30980 (plasmid) [Bacillus cereus]|uniref:PqqD family protein n=1 Tax=Bacillus cereus TaxID=1396 RepID=A0AB73USB2_BACCE|nr:hypothetical protein [Bacillus cereus]HDR3523493.1 hypothetical protein [Bacillus pacificus]QHV07985.1 hypothetical protein C1N82_32840 [Bacillus cereus]QHV47446.1 hypothetical protein C1N66_30980 [Bacillus cereus]HDR3634050.1 hypothetical protein [Bacillus pacificus]HDR7652986.1 hypothetical protein [Bacillus pacificus]